MRILWVIVLWICSFCLHGQEALFVYTAEDGIYLRWQGVRNDALDGYHVYRKTGEGEFERLTSQALSFPQSTEAVKERIPGKDDLFYALLGLSGGKVSAADVKRASEHEVMGGLFEATFAADADMAELLAERFIDRTAVKGMVYTYRISTLINQTEQTLHEKKLLKPYQAQSGPQAPELRIVPGDGELSLYCNPPPSALKSGEIVSWLVFRSDKANGPFQRVNLQMSFPSVMQGTSSEKAKATLSFRDGFLANDREYFYRVQMVNVAGVIGPQSKVYSGIPKEVASANILLAWDVEALARKVVLRWKSQKAGLPYSILRANQRFGTYKPVHRGMLRNGAESWLDAEYIPGELRYYFLEIQDENDRIWRSDTLDALYAERLPPVTPENFSATLRDTFFVDMQWTPSSTPGSMYDVERLTGNNSRSAVKVNSLPLKQIQFTDTLKRNASGVYQYRVRAVSASLQHSEPTPAVSIEVPDFVAPQSPIVLRLEQVGKEGMMNWHPVPEQDLAKYQVFWSVNEGEWKLAHESNETTFRFPLEENASFYMAVRAVDHSGNTGLFSDTLKLHLKAEAPEAPVIELVEKRGKGLELSWVKGNTSTIHRLVLSRVDPVSGKRLDIWQGKPETNQFFDKYADADKPWRFELTAYDRKWRRGNPSTFLYEPEKTE